MMTEVKFFSLMQVVTVGTDSLYFPLITSRLRKGISFLADSLEAAHENEPRLAVTVGDEP